MPRYIAEDGRGLVAVTMHILGRVVGLGVWLVTPGSELKLSILYLRSTFVSSTLPDGLDNCIYMSI